MLIAHVTSSWFCLYLLNIYLFTYTSSHAHTETHTHKHTCIISTQEDGDNQVQEPATVERSGRKAFIRDKGRPCAPPKKKGRKKMWAAPHPPTKMGAKCLSAVVLDNQDLAFSQLAPVPEMKVEPTS